MAGASLACPPSPSPIKSFNGCSSRTKPNEFYLGISDGAETGVMVSLRVMPPLSTERTKTTLRREESRETSFQLYSNVKHVCMVYEWGNVSVCRRVNPGV